MGALRLRNRVWALVARLALLFGLGLLLACCGATKPSAGESLQRGFADLRTTAATTIADAERREAYLDLVGRMESELIAFEAYASEFIDEYRRAFTDHAVDQATVERLATTFRARQRDAQVRFVDLHLAMARSVSEDEWAVLSQQETAIVKRLLSGTTGGRQ